MADTRIQAAQTKRTCQSSNSEAVNTKTRRTKTRRSDQVFPKAIAGTFSSTRGGSSAAR